MPTLKGKVILCLVQNLLKSNCPMKNAKVLRNWSDVITHPNRSPCEVGSF
jgi:hypothetical protein